LDNRAVKFKKEMNMSFKPGAKIYGSLVIEKQQKILMTSFKKSPTTPLPEQGGRSSSGIFIAGQRSPEVECPVEFRIGLKTGCS